MNAPCTIWSQLLVIPVSALNGAWKSCWLLCLCCSKEQVGMHLQAVVYTWWIYNRWQMQYLLFYDPTQVKFYSDYLLLILSPLSFIPSKFGRERNVNIGGKTHKTH